MSSTTQVMGHGTAIATMAPEHADDVAWGQALHEAMAASAQPANGQATQPTITQQLDKLDAWERRVREFAKVPAEAIKHPLHGITTGTAKMQQPREQLNAALAALDQADKVKAQIRGPSFASRPHDEQVRMAQHVDTLISNAQDRLRTANAQAHDANSAILKKRADQAGALANGAKATFELAPKLVDALVTAATKNPALGTAAGTVTKLAGQGAAAATNKAIGGSPDAVKPLGSPAQTFDEGAIKIAFDALGAKLPEGARKEVGDLAGDALKDALTSADKARLQHKSVEEIKHDAIKGAEEGITGKIGGLAGKRVSLAPLKPFIHAAATAVGSAAVAKLNHEDPKGAALGGAQKAVTGDVIRGAAGKLNPAPAEKPK